MDRAILHCDCNSFFASIEMLYHPEYRDRPLAVTGDPLLRHGIILTSNYPAKAFGVRTGMPIRKVREICPEIVLLPARMPLYMKFSEELRKMYSEYTDLVEPFGCDEAWLDVTHSEKLFGTAPEIAEKIRRRVIDEFGITVSIGISFNKIFAKLGSDYKKPDAVTDMRRECYKEKILPLPVTDLLYVGRSTAKILAKEGIFTIGELADASSDLLEKRLGKLGTTLKAFANGLDASPVSAGGGTEGIRSVGNSMTAYRDLETLSDVKVMLYMLAEAVSSRLRKLGFRCRMIEISVRDSRLFVCTKQRKLDLSTDSVSEIAEEALLIFNGSYRWQAPIRSIGLRACSLVSADYAEQFDLFSDPEKRKKLSAADRAVDELRGRFGYFSVQRGLMLEEPALSHLDVTEAHAAHPVSFFGGKGYSLQ